MSDTTTQIQEYPHGITFEQVWAALLKGDQQMKELREQMKETDRQMKESQAETDRQMKESQAETDRQMKETDRQMKESQAETDRLLKETQKEVKKITKLVGGLGNSIGGLVETLIAARLWEKFSSYPYGFKRAYRRVQVFDYQKNKELTDIDILLSDTEWVMAVEVKNEVTLKEVERHIKRMGLIRLYPPAEAKGKKLLGALAGGTIEPDALDFAHGSGFFLLELKGESVVLVKPPESFVPKEWSEGN
jgi:hypothetical protein